MRCMFTGYALFSTRLDNKLSKFLLSHKSSCRSYWDDYAICHVYLSDLGVSAKFKKLFVELLNFESTAFEILSNARRLRTEVVDKVLMSYGL